MSRFRINTILDLCLPQDQASMLGALAALRVLVRKYEFKTDEKRAALEDIVQATFPQLLVIFKVPLHACTAR